VLILERQISTHSWDINTGYCKKHLEHINTLCEQNAEILLMNMAVHTLTSMLYRVGLIELSLINITAI